LLAILPLVLSTPIPAWSTTVVNKPAVNDKDSQDRVTAFNQADARAKEMVQKMAKVANSDKPEHKKIVNDAFGPNADRSKIKATIKKLDTEPVRIGTTDVAGVKADLVATTPVTRPNGPTGNIKLGPNFFAADSSKDYRAGTLIHEATHQQSHTGDLINKNDRIVGALEDQKTNIKMQENGRPHIGYHFPGEANPKKVPTSAADLSDKYKNNRDKVVKNMHDNADSYRVFAHLCSQPGVARRDIELFSRALLEADADDHFYLAKRSSCALPKDYFKNKAAAKAAAPGKGAKAAVPGKGTKATASGKGTKAAAPGKGTKSIKPTSRLTKGAATKGAQGHTVSKAGRKPSAVKELKGAGKQVSPATSPRRTSRKGASGVKSLASTKSTKPISRVAKEVTQGKVKQVAQKKGGSSVKSQASTKSTKPLSRVAKGVMQAKGNHVTHKKGAAAVPKKSTPHAAKKGAAAVPKKSTPQTARPKKGAAPVPKKSTPHAAKKVAAAIPKKLTPQTAPPKKAGKK
jgi:hypothetical protein